MAKASIKVSGMKCGGCEKTVQTAADAVSGVQSSKASFKDGTLEVEYDEAKTSVAAIQQSVTAAGFPSA
jgi:copper chaperone